VKHGKPRFVPFEYCDDCPEERDEQGNRKDRYPENELSHFGDERLCPVHAACRLIGMNSKGKAKAIWRQTDHPGDFYDRVVKNKDDRQ
jgi:hypothetical protein